ncbi:protein translocase subunit SecF [Tropheryma whipplei]|uniref:Protein-export membrane protein SecF n=1 Tax=Tropheryma whipplei (strain Twist) TaxID=203267 RepID=Q83MZ6_TROWT|nr:protein translocase subunit SecF [Tropheryma whipplei]AAO44369.1 protein-export membrane protein SecF [Tropheryma whipplei str. Twist]MCO8182634.1 protein translocase subunit SecF [Tropheryma whipplei]
MAWFARFSDDLYSGRRSIDFVGRYKIWYSASFVILLVAILGPFFHGGYKFGIEFTGGSQFVISDVKQKSIELAREVVKKTVDKPSVVTTFGKGLVVRTDQLSDTQSNSVRDALADTYGVSHDAVAASYIGPSWGQDVTRQGIQGLVIFLLLVFVVMALYFRTWRMSLSAIIALFHDLIITAGIYGLLGLEITPAAVIGLLTILGYSLYDTVVVFDRVRENRALDPTCSDYKGIVNRAVNQTFVRSINTSLIAVLPVASILFIGSLILGASTLSDISVALFIGMLAGAYSTIVIASPTYALLCKKLPSGKEKRLRKASVKAPG